ncbi:sigma-70 family RNA polymerase sigma factor [Cystobacter fuscus]|uniref:sigma-70 family RNA polymerase sigma factor n=1 Tax=Cystobacter fuscus TaxID=43 RepID=UPI0037C086B1
MSQKALSEMSFEELIQRARAGEHGALGELLQRSSKRLEQWARQHGGQRYRMGERPSDISQGIRERVLRGFRSFKGNTAGEWFVWLKMIFENGRKQSIRDAKRQKRAAPEPGCLDDDDAREQPSPDKSPSYLVARQEEWHWLYVCLYQLPEDQGQAMQMRHLQHLPVTEIMKRLGKTRASVEGLLFRGLERVTAQMKQYLALPGEESTTPPRSTNEAETAFVSYLRLRDAGQEINREAWLAEHPACADKLRDMLHWVDRLHAHVPTSAKKK